MKNNNYPTWLVPLEIAQGLKEIGFGEPCVFKFERCEYTMFKMNIDSVFEDTSEYYFDDLETYKKGYNTRGYDILRPSWDDTLAWFRAKGYKITFKDINIGTQCAFYHLDINEGHTFSYFAKKYEKARERLVMKLIEIHKEFGNNIKRFD